MAGIDRRKHDIDVMERVLDNSPPDASHTEVIVLDARPGIAGMTTSAVQLTVNVAMPADRQITGRPRRPE